MALSLEFLCAQTSQDLSSTSKDTAILRASSIPQALTGTIYFKLIALIVKLFVRPSSLRTGTSPTQSPFQPFLLTTAFLPPWTLHATPCMTLSTTSKISTRVRWQLNLNTQQQRKRDSGCMRTMRKPWKKRSAPLKESRCCRLLSGRRKWRNSCRRNLPRIKDTLLKVLKRSQSLLTLYSQRHLCAHLPPVLQSTQCQACLTEVDQRRLWY